MHDFDVAETLFQNEKYDWCLFIGHLVIEKVLKAFYVRDRGKMPPKVHNLVILAERTSMHLSDEQKRLLDEINRFNIEARDTIINRITTGSAQKNLLRSILQRLRGYINATITDEVIEIAEKFFELLKASNFRIEKAILFGSYIKGNVTEWSDMDIAVISPDFSGIGFYDSKMLILFY